MSGNADSFDWKQVDQTLVNLMLFDIIQEIRKNTEDEERQIRFANIGNQNAMTVPSQRLEMHLRRADELAGRTYEVCCEVWKRQGNSLSPEFLRAIPQFGIRAVISSRTGAVLWELEMEEKRTGAFNTEWLNAAGAEFRRSMERLFAKWVRKAEIDAKTLEHQLRATSHDPRGKDAIQKLDPVPSESLALGQPDVAQVPQSKETPKLKYRSHLKRAIALQFINNTSASDLDICRGLDADGAIELPTEWTIHKNRLFEVAYRNPAIRRRIEITISKVRTDLRKKGFL